MTPDETGEVLDRVSLPRLRHVMGTDWRDFARCAKLPKEVFFNYASTGMHRKYVKSRISAARAVCRACPVRDKCYEFSVKNNETHGIWAGVLPDERKRLYQVFKKTGILEKMPTL